MGVGFGRDANAFPTSYLFPVFDLLSVSLLAKLLLTLFRFISRKDRATPTWKEELLVQVSFLFKRSHFRIVLLIDFVV